jgi:UDP-N-acetyl-D-glucosamine dehydrogenase
LPLPAVDRATPEPDSGTHPTSFGPPIALFDDALSIDRDAPVAVPERSPSVAIVGMGYVGLPTALGMLEAGLSVIGLDVSQPRLAAIRERRVDLIADDRDRLRRWLPAPQFDLTADVRRLSDADVVVICVPTPVDEHRLPDLTALRAACETVVEHAVLGQTIVLTSTTYVGSTRDLVIEPLRARGYVPGRDIYVAFAPERIDPGNIQHSQESVPRVIGGYTAECGRRATAVIGRVAPVHLVSSPEVAELTKLYENTFRAVNIALANEFETLSGALEVDMLEVIRAASTKPFGFMPFYPGTGVGGHCIPCDPHYLLWQLRALRHDAPLIERAMASIAHRPDEMVERLAAALTAHGRRLDGARVIVVGVTYKAGVEDIRESPALDIIHELHRRGATVEYFDPLVDRLTLTDGTVISGTARPEGDSYDAALIHVVQPDAELGWLRQCPVVIDPAGRARRREPVAIPVGPGSRPRISAEAG